MEDSPDIVKRLCEGEEQAASEVFHRYANRLIAFAHSRMSARFAGRFDAEDVVQSAYGSFFCRARDQRLDLTGGGDLWSLLVAITMNKLRKRIEFHSAAKRHVGRDRSIDGDSPGQMAESREPSPREQAALWDEIDLLTRDLSEQKREIVQLRLAGWLIEEIAGKVGRSERMVRRVMEQMRNTLGRRLAEAQDDGAQDDGPA